MQVEKITKPITPRQADLKAWAGFWWSVDIYEFHGIEVHRNVLPWVVKVFNTLVDDKATRKLKRRAAKLALNAVQEMLKDEQGREKAG